MAVSLTRSVYINSQVWITPVAGATRLTNINNAGNMVALPQNASYTLNIPRADVNAFGFDGVIARPQLEAETATIEFSFIPQGATGAYTKDMSGDGWNDLIVEAKAGQPEYVTVQAFGVGGIKNALMGSLSGEVNVGALASMSASFSGATHNVDNLQQVITAEDAAGNIINAVDLNADGLVDFDTEAAPKPGSGSADASSSVGSSFVAAGSFGVGTVLNPEDINLTVFPNSPQSASSTLPLLDEGDEVNADDATDVDLPVRRRESCAQSASFSWDMPVEVILCLGQDPTSDGMSLGNPPGTSSITVEALSAQLSHRRDSASYSLLFGLYHLALLQGNIDSRTHNLAVGDLYGTYNYVIGGTGDGFEIG